MPTVRVELPGLLADLLDHQRALTLSADTIANAFARIRHDHPRLALHVFDESGQLREHVLCFWNGTNTRWLDELDHPLCPGDTLLFMQAVSGG